MEKSKYLIQDNPNSKQTRNTWQRENDFKALTRLSILYTYDGNIEKTRSKPIVDFFNGVKKFKNNSVYSASMQENLIAVKKNWKTYKNSPVIEEICEYVKKAAVTTISLENSDSIFDGIEKYYNSDKNRTYFSVEKLLSDIVNNTINEEQAIEDFNAFTKMLEKEIGVLNESESE